MRFKEKYTHSGTIDELTRGGSFSDWKSQINEASEDEVSFQIDDNGIGIDGKKFSMVFHERINSGKEENDFGEEWVHMLFSYDVIRKFEGTIGCLDKDERAMYWGMYPGAV
ncbi:hypothetical protein COV17_00685 [Candidatus Woesearchaeota archaeon CG10_big_fil_rev_8_21_14_0_10_36_11]|nr:MAG: hypothetical protein COV17_00685 [Candidatus Woesearchaeota archaeon CG10_big_fil_rev_8_21_14_0_10_36_11]